MRGSENKESLHSLKLRAQIALLTRKSLNPYARQAIIDLVRRDGIKGRSRCQEWARNVRWHVDGIERRPWDKPNAYDTARALLSTPYVLEKGQPLQDGDFLYDFSNPETLGHVGIIIPNNYVAENSIVHYWGGDGRGIRSLRKYNYWDIAVRFPIEWAKN